MNKTLLAGAAAAALLGLAACGGGGSDDDDDALPTPVTVGDTVALTTTNQLMSFNRATPATQVGIIRVTGLASNENLLGIDVRPADNTLYALGSSGAVYTLDPATGIATRKSTLKAASGDDNPFTALAGVDFGVDFNPVADRMRVISNTGLNLRINVDTGDTITDGTIAPTTGTAVITAAAYTNSLTGTTSTALFDIDGAAGLLYLQDPPNNGTLGAGIALGVTATTVNGFDIDARSNAGYAALTVGGVAGLYRINLAATTAAATLVGATPSGSTVRGLALLQPAAPAALGLTTDNRLVGFDPKAPNTLKTTVSIGGLQVSEVVVGIDVRPSDRLLYALTNSGRVYTVDTTTGVATLKSSLAADSADATAPYTALAGTVFSVDFNPVADRMRVISDLGQSLRINVDTGATTTDGEINRTSPARVVAAAYTNSFAGTTATTLFDLEANSDVLSRQDPPNNGTLVDIGPLGLNLDGATGFDIGGGSNGLALAAFSAVSGGPASLYAVSLTTGAATLALGATTPASSVIGGASGPALKDLAILF
ncbi:hypothetical protein BH10PSE17_BH10PSE17_18760 [soil metagenome]